MQFVTLGSCVESMDDNDRHPALAKRIRDAGTNSNALRALSGLHLCLMGNGELGNGGLIQHYLEKWTAELVNLSDLSKTVGWSPAEIDKFMTAQVQRQLKGLILWHSTAQPRGTVTRQLLIRPS